ncbi:MAG: peptidoglycan DD-metalloendopeptidase family protein, partial [Psychrobacter sp.]|nr:peptidoglycan DD-metalloendopeptidase family protein [Psychrobacter sp.]
MSQAFVVAKNDYKKFVDGMMNDTGGASSKIAGFITGISGNFDTLAKVAIAGVGLAFAQMAISIGTASTAMGIFNIIAAANPLILVASGFLAVSSAIYGTNEVIDLSGVIIKDLMTELGDMANFLGNTWNDISDWIMENVLKIEKAIGDSNDKNRKSYFGFYEETEKGFAGLVQRIMGNVASVGALTGTMITYYQTFVDNLTISVTNLMTAFENLYKMGKNLFGGDEKLGNFQDYKVMDVIQMYRNENSANQDVVANYVRGANQRAGTADPTYSNPLRSRYFKSGFGDLMTPGANSVLKPQTSIPANLRAPNSQISTEPMDMIKKKQYDQLKAQEAITAATKEREKLAKAQAKAASSSELVRKAVLGGKDWGLSQGGGFAGARGHNGIDIPTPVGTQVYAPESGTIKAYGSNASRGGKQMILIADSGKKYGFAHLDSFDVANGTRVPAGMGIAKTGATGKRPNGKGYSAHLHLTVTDINGKKVDPTKLSVGKTGYDNTIGKANASAAAKAERERIKAAEEAQKEQERIANLRLKLIKDYGDKELQLNIENDERVAEIKDAGFNGAKEAELIEQSKQRMNRELAVYKKGLDDKISELVSFQKTERELLKKQYDDDVFNLVSDPELSRPENKQYMTEALANAKTLNDYRVSLYEQSLEEQKTAMYAFQKTERQILLDNWNNKLADAENQYDELRDYRISALVAEGRQEISIFDTNQSL